MFKSAGPSKGLNSLADNLHTVLAHLEKVKKHGRNYTACCPVHSEKTPSLSLTVDASGRLLAHCFGCGANGLDVLKTLGLDLALLGGEAKERPEALLERIETNIREAKFTQAVAQGMDESKLDYFERKALKKAAAMERGGLGKRKRLSHDE